MNAENTTENYRVVLVDDHAIFRSGLRADLAQDIQIVGEAGTVEGA
ncbi:MAG: DNA-binding response regulator, partial [Glutamicibacter sp.]